MPSIVASAFRDRVAASLQPDYADILDHARGGAPEFRDMHRALMMADRAIRDFAPAAIAEQRPRAPNRYETLGTIGRPEDHHADARRAADQEVRAARTPEQDAVTRAVQALTDAITDLDTESSVSGNTPAIEAAAEAAADVSPPQALSTASPSTSSRRPTSCSATSFHWLAEPSRVRDSSSAG